MGVKKPALGELSQVATWQYWGDYSGINASRRAAMSTFMLQLVGLWVVMVLTAWAVYEIKDDWRA